MTSEQCADFIYCCDYFKYSRQMAHKARLSTELL